MTMLDLRTVIKEGQAIASIDEIFFNAEKIYGATRIGNDESPVQIDRIIIPIGDDKSLAFYRYSGEVNPKYQLSIREPRVSALDLPDYGNNWGTTQCILFEIIGNEIVIRYAKFLEEGSVVEITPKDIPALTLAVNSMLEFIRS